MSMYIFIGFCVNFVLFVVFCKVNIRFCSVYASSIDKCGVVH